MDEETEVVVEDQGQSMDDFMGDQFDALESEDSESEIAPTTEEQSVSEETAKDDVAESAESDVESEGSEPENQTITAPQSMSAKERNG